MALPELLANSATPGAVVPLGTLSAAMTDTTGLSMSVSASTPNALRAVVGQFRVVVDSEIMLVAASASGASPWTILQRGAEPEGPATTHLSGASVFHYLTAGALAAVTAPQLSVPALPTRPLGNAVQLTTNGSGATAYKAFPSLCKIPGTVNLLMLYYVSTADGATDAAIWKMVLQPVGDGTCTVVTAETTLWASTPTTLWYGGTGLLAMANGNILCLRTRHTASTTVLESLSSSDGGVTWSTASALPVPWTTAALEIGGPPVQTADGTIYAAAYGSDGASDYSRLFKSVDSGVTWTNAGIIVNTSGWAEDEPCLTVLKDGQTLLCYVRTTVNTSLPADATLTQGYIGICSNPSATTPTWTFRRGPDTHQKTSLLYTPDGDLIANPSTPGTSWTVAVGGNLVDQAGFLIGSADEGNTWSPPSFEPSLVTLVSRRYSALCWLGPINKPYNVAFAYACNAGAASNVFWIPVGAVRAFPQTAQIISATATGSVVPVLPVFINGSTAVASQQVWCSIDSAGVVHLGGKITPGAVGTSTMIQLPNWSLGWAPHQDVLWPPGAATPTVKVDTKGSVWNLQAGTTAILLDGLSFKANAP